MAIQLSTVVTAVLRRLGDPNSTIWTNAEIKVYIQEGYDRIVYQTFMLWKRDTTLDDVAGTATYSLPSDFYRMERVTWNNYRIKALDIWRLRQLNAGYRVNQGNVYGYTLEDEGLSTIRKVLVPSLSASGKFAIEYFRRGAAVSNDTDTFSLPDPYLKYIRFYAIARACQREGKGMDLNKAAHYMERFTLGVGLAKKRVDEARRLKQYRFGGTRLYRAYPPRPVPPWNFER